MLDFAAYLDRVGLVASPSLTPALLQRAQVTHIPFENLDAYLGSPVSLDQADLERKLVHDRRGGYCFEQNLLLKSALVQIGAEVEMMLARVRVGADPHRVRPLTHLVLRVRHGGVVWLADAGFGGGTLLEPIPFAAGGEHDQSGWRYRLVDEGGGLALQLHREGAWDTQYGFVPEPVPFTDLEVGNWFTSTHPSSPFVRTVRLAVRGEDGGQTALDGDPAQSNGLTLVEQTPAGSRSEVVARTELPALLESRFGIAGFGLDGTGRLVRVSPAPPDPLAVAAMIGRLRAGEEVGAGELGPAVAEAILAEPRIAEALDGLEEWLDGIVDHEAALALAASWAQLAAGLDLDAVGAEARLYIDAYPLEARVLEDLTDRAATWLVARLAETAPEAVARLPSVRRAITALASLAAPRFPSASASLRAAEAALDDEALWYQVALGVVRVEILAEEGRRE